MPPLQNGCKRLFSKELVIRQTITSFPGVSCVGINCAIIGKWDHLNTRKKVLDEKGGVVMITKTDLDYAGSLILFPLRRGQRAAETFPRRPSTGRL